jgi:hypothetical protein
VYAAKENPRWQDWKFSSARGDGAVPVWSAANTLGKSLPGSLPSFSEHATIFDDKGVDLISNAPPLVSATDAIFQLTTTAGVTSYSLIDVAVEPTTVRPGASVNLSVTIDFNDDIKRGVHADGPASRTQWAGRPDRPRDQHLKSAGCSHDELFGRNLGATGRGRVAGECPVPRPRPFL